MRAGDYSMRFEWLRREDGTPDGFGQRADAYPSQGYLWGALQDLTGGRQGAKESERQVVTAVVRLRNYPAVAPGDRLYDTYGETWTIDTAVPLDNEVYCDVTRPRWTAGGGTAE